MKHTALYRTATERVLASMSRTDAGVWVANLVLHRLHGDCTDEELGKALVDSLEASRLDMPHPTSMPGHQRQLRDLLGVMMLERFFASARLVNVHLLETAVVLTPHRNRGVKHGHEPLAKMTLTDLTPRELGAAARAGEGRCE